MVCTSHLTCLPEVSCYGHGAMIAIHIKLNTASSIHFDYGARKPALLFIAVVLTFLALQQCTFVLSLRFRQFCLSSSGILCCLCLNSFCFGSCLGLFWNF